jgi:PAS domain S-box-containing protein
MRSNFQRRSSKSVSSSGLDMHQFGPLWRKFHTYCDQQNIRGYWLGFLAIVFAFIWRLLIDPWLGDQMPYATFIVAVAGIGLYAGVRPAIFVTLLGGATAYFCFVPPRYHWGFARIQDEVGFSVYILGALGIVILTRARDRVAKNLETITTEIKESESRFHTLADNIAQLAWMADEKGRLFWFNQRWLDYTGTTLAAMEGSGWQKVHHPDHIQRVIERIQRAWVSGEPWEDTFPLRGKDGSYRWFLSRALPIRNDEGSIIRWFGTNTDVTERMNTEENLRRSEKLAAVGKLAAGVAHELNNPLTTVVNLVFLAQHESNESNRRDYLVRADLELQRVSSLANRTLSFYHGGTSEGMISLEELIKEAVTIFEPGCAQRNIKLTSEVTGALAVKGSKDQLWQVLVNLLSNAIDAVGQNGVIRVRTKGTGNPTSGIYKIRLTVADNGCGIDQKNSKKIFEPFFTTKGAVSSGLGLWIARDVLISHGGGIRYRSRTDPGHSGTVMSVILPAANVIEEKEIKLPTAS